MLQRMNFKYIFQSKLWVFYVCQEILSLTATKIFSIIIQLSIFCVLGQRMLCQIRYRRAFIFYACNQCIQYNYILIQNIHTLSVDTQIHRSICANSIILTNFENKFSQYQKMFFLKYSIFRGYFQSIQIQKYILKIQNLYYFSKSSKILLSINVMTRISQRKIYENICRQFKFAWLEIQTAIFSLVFMKYNRFLHRLIWLQNYIFCA
eukprot:TRINITY_DN1896_c0_g2_i1.p3 TRINITY_DN1896_c0_g2~~TRINITY_DN1896_c0_g2_i1.p3  ORF type:complete len:207 (+),score=-15.55 TRINITY_DN1896_c0_g2_i1:1056-1676(+)